MTRGAITPGLLNKDLDGKKLAVKSNENLDACLIETTVEGVNPVKVEPSTRADIITRTNLGLFSSTGLRGTAANAINVEWFPETTTNADGSFKIQLFLGHGYNVTLVSMQSTQRERTATIVLLSSIRQLLLQHQALNLLLTLT